MRSKAASVKNFAVHLTRMLFQPEELRGRNVRRVAGKQPLNPDKVKVIMDAVCKFYPASPEGRDFQWRDCRKAVDTYLRGIKFSERNQIVLAVFCFLDLDFTNRLDVNRINDA